MDDLISELHEIAQDAALIPLKITQAADLIHMGQPTIGHTYISQAIVTAERIKEKLMELHKEDKDGNI